MKIPLEGLAERAERDPFFLACPLRWFARSEALTEDGLAEFLGCTREALVKVRLCATPDADSPRFASELRAVAQRFGAKETALVKAVRRGVTVLQMQAAPAAHLAARDRKPEEPA